MSKESDEVWCAFLLAISKGEKEVEMTDGWKGLMAVKATKLISYLPLIIKLQIYNAKFEVKFMTILI